MKLDLSSWGPALMSGLRGFLQDQNEFDSLGTIWHGPTEAVNAISLDGGDELQICFRNLTDETLLLCWVDENGNPHHFYKLQPFCNQQNDDSAEMHDVTDDEHIETTCCGHAFLLARADDIEHCASQMSLEDAEIIGAYRAVRVRPLNFKSDIDDDKLLHLVTINDRSSEIEKKRKTTIGNLRGCCRVRPNLEFHENGDEILYYLKVRMLSVDITPIDNFGKKYVAGTLGKFKWPIFAEPQYDEDTEFKEIFECDVDRAMSFYPEKARKKLRDQLPTPIWINRNIKYGPRNHPIVGKEMCYHTDHRWLVQNGLSAEKGKSVELYCIEYYKELRKLWGIGGVVVHEFSHAYHDKCLKDGFDNKEIIECYKAAMKEGLYDEVRVKGTQGPTNKAYACTNHMEYFAELSTAFLGGGPANNESQEGKCEYEYNKWYPFNRRQIKEHDPRAYEMLKTMWEVEDE